MMVPSGKPLFENVSSKDYYARESELRERALNGCIRIEYPDFEEIIMFSEGRAATAIHQSGRWLTVDDDLVGPAENKALAAGGKMTAYELSQGLLNVFIHMHVASMVETELGPYMTAGPLIGYLESDKATGILKLDDGRSSAHLFFNFGKLAGAVYASPEGRQYDDGAIKAAGGFKERTCVAIYFLEMSPKYLKSKDKAKAEARAQIPEVPLPVTTAQPPAPPEPVTPFPVEATRPRQQAARPLIQAPARAPLPGIKLVVVMSEDGHIGLRHRSRQQTLEAFEEGNIAWVDGRTLTLLLGSDVNIILPDGREYRVTLKEAPIRPEEGRYIILPRKLRSRLSIGKGETVEVRASV